MLFRVPTYMWFMLVVTAAYLTVEIPFSIHLVRMLGGLATPDDIQQAERFGRILTGVAVALAYVGMRFYPMCHAANMGFFYMSRHALVRIIPIVAVVFFGLHYYGEFRGLLSSGPTRSEAYVANLARNSIVADGVNGHAPSDDPAWLGLMTGLSSVFTPAKLVSMTGKSVSDLAMNEARRVIGSPSEAKSNLDNILSPVADKGYSDYLRGSQRFNDGMADASRQAAAKWDDFQRQLRAKFGSDFPRAGTMTHRYVVNRLRNEGVDVPLTYNLRDRATFMRASLSPVYEKALRDFKSQMTYSVDYNTKLVPGLDKLQFFADPGVQSLIRSKAGSLTLPKNVVIHPGMQMSDFAASVYPMMLKGAYDKIHDFATAGPNGFYSQASASVGESAVKAATLPATALLLSLAGALFHIYKLGTYLVGIFGKLSRIRFVSEGIGRHALAFSMLIVCAFSMKTGVGSATETLLSSADGGAFSKVIGQTVAMEPGLFIIGDKMAEVGPWRFIGHMLPPARPAYRVALAGNVSSDTTASIASASVEHPVAAETAVAFATDVPVPTPAPR